MTRFETVVVDSTFRTPHLRTYSVSPVTALSRYAIRACTTGGKLPHLSILDCVFPQPDTVPRLVRVLHDAHVMSHLTFLVCGHTSCVQPLLCSGESTL